MIGKVYKIIHNQSNVIYVGSTFGSLIARWVTHKKDYKAWLEDKGDCISIYPYFKQHSIENFRIILIKEYEVIDRRHLETYESLWIFKLKACNKRNSFALPLIKHYAQIYAKEHKEHLAEIGKIYRENNKETIRARRRMKTDCDCGTTYSRDDKARHERSLRHKKYLEDGTVTIFRKPPILDV
jgi:hypothetical protein